MIRHFLSLKGMITAEDSDRWFELDAFIMKTTSCLFDQRVNTLTCRVVVKPLLGNRLKRRINIRDKNSELFDRKEGWINNNKDNNNKGGFT